MDTFPCIQCNKEVTSRSHAIACDSCGRWNHRKCNTEITHQQYIQLRRGDISIQWRCNQCDQIEDVDMERSRHNSTTNDDLDPPLNIPVSPLRSVMNINRTDSGIERLIPDNSFNISDQFIQPTPVMEESLDDRVLTDDLPEEVPVTFEIVVEGSKRRGAKLVSSDGYTYTKGTKSGERQYWRCSIRSKKMVCPASVKQYKDMFTPGLGGHVHPADPGAANKVKIAKKVKDVAKERMFEPAASIVERVMVDMVGPHDTNLPKIDNLTRAANHYRRLRPNDPSDIHFEIDHDFIGDDFVIDDIHMDGARHVMFATQHQLTLLRQARRWFLDGTFKVVKDPFYQLLTVHVFVKKGDDEKQVPLVYVLMSRRSKDDYVQVLDSLKRKLGNLLLEWVMLDFEAATWQAVRTVFPGAVIKGCVFHLTQRIYRKIQGEGLGPAYIERGDKYEYLRKLMSLPYLPVEQIVPAFERLLVLAEEVDGPILRVAKYMERTWIRGSVWQPQHWCVFREMVRTNNDLEGWHRRLNGRAGHPNLGFYKLIVLLKGESQTVDIQIRLVSQNLLSKIRRKKYRDIHGKLEQAWDRYEEEEITTSSLLRTVSNVVGLGPTQSAHHMFSED